MLTVFCLCTGTFVVGFVEIAYTVIEGDGQVEVCVNLTSPEGDIGDERVLVEVFDNTHPGSIPANAAAASKLALSLKAGVAVMSTAVLEYKLPLTKLSPYQENDLIHMYSHNIFISTAADTFSLGGFYRMDEGADYPPVIAGFNPIMNMVITGTNRVICYNQTIYDDDRVEEDEFFSLTLTVQDGSAQITLVDPQLSTAVIKIVDDDGEFKSLCCTDGG